MRRITPRIVIAVLPVLLVAAYAVARRPTKTPARAAAEAAYHEALDRALADDAAGYVDRLAEVWRIDPDWVQPFIDAYDGAKPARFFRLWDEAAARVHDPELRHCLRTRMGPARRGQSTPLSGIREIRDDADLCNALVDLDLAFKDVPDSIQLSLAEQSYAYQNRAYGGVGRMLQVLSSKRQWKRLADVSQATIDGDHHPLIRSHGYAHRSIALHQSG